MATETAAHRRSCQFRFIRLAGRELVAVEAAVTPAVAAPGVITAEGALAVLALVAASDPVPGPAVAGRPGAARV